MKHIATLVFYTSIKDMTYEDIAAFQTMLATIGCEIDKGEHLDTKTIEVFVGDDRTTLLQMELPFEYSN